MKLRLTSPSQILARQHAITLLGELAPQTQEAISTLEAEVARNNQETIGYATKALVLLKSGKP